METAFDSEWVFLSAQTPLILSGVRSRPGSDMLACKVDPFLKTVNCVALTCSTWSSNSVMLRKFYFVYNEVWKLHHLKPLVWSARAAVIRPITRCRQCGLWFWCFSTMRKLRLLHLRSCNFRYSLSVQMGSLSVKCRFDFNVRSARSWKTQIPMSFRTSGVDRRSMSFKNQLRNHATTHLD